MTRREAGGSDGGEGTAKEADVVKEADGWDCSAES